MSELRKINLSELASTYEPIPDGEYEIKLDNLDPTVSAAGNDTVKVTYVITKGPRKGTEIFQWYTPMSTKNGKVSYMGLSQMASIYKKIGVPESLYSELSTDKVEAGKLFQKLVKGKVMEAYITTEQRKDDPNKTSTRVNIVGLAGGAVEEEVEDEE